MSTLKGGKLLVGKGRKGKFGHFGKYGFTRGKLAKKPRGTLRVNWRAPG